MKNLSVLCTTKKILLLSMAFSIAFSSFNINGWSYSQFFNAKSTVSTATSKKIPNIIKINNAGSQKSISKILYNNWGKIVIITAIVGASAYFINKFFKSKRVDPLMDDINPLKNNTNALISEIQDSRIRQKEKAKKEDALKEMPFVGKNNVQNPHPNLTNCAICLDDHTTDKDVLKLPCGHIYHEDCLYKWFLNKDKKNSFYNMTCPCCRQEITEDFIEKYLLSIIGKNREKKEFKQELLFLAATKGYVDILKELFKPGMNVDVNNAINVEVYVYTATGESIITIEKNHTPLHFAANRSNFDTDNPKKRLETIKLLVENGVNASAKDANGRKAIDLILSQNRNSEAYKYLEGKMAEQLEKDSKEKTKMVLAKQALISALRYGSIKKLKDLDIKNKKIDINFFHGEEKQTPLHLAVRIDNPEARFQAVKLLVEDGKADIRAKNSHGEMPIEETLDKESETYKYLIERMELTK